MRNVLVSSAVSFFCSFAIGVVFAVPAVAAVQCSTNDPCRVSGKYIYWTGISEISGEQMDEVGFIPDARSARVLGQSEGFAIVFRDANDKRHFLPKKSSGYAELKITDYIRNEDAPEMGDRATLVEVVKISSAQSAKTAPDRLRGRILLQVESNGEAWYVRPDTGTRVPMGRPADAFLLMRTLGVGIANADLEKLPIAFTNFEGGADGDGDGLSDMAEAALGTDPSKADTDRDGYNDKTEVLGGFDPVRGDGAKYPINMSFAKKHAGKIFIAAQRNGEAWYIHPAELKRYYLGRPHHAFEIMRRTGLGITNVDVTDIKESDFLKNLSDAALSNAQAKARDSKRIADMKQASVELYVLETTYPGSAIQCGNGDTLDKCTAPEGLGDIGKLTDPTGSTPCEPGASAPCAYAIYKGKGSGMATPNDYQICFYLEYGAANLKKGLHALSSDGTFTSCQIKSFDTKQASVKDIIDDAKKENAASSQAE